MTASEESKRKRVEIAKRLALFFPGLEINDVPSGYTSLRVGTGPLTNCVTVSPNGQRASFLLSNPDLRQAIEAAGFEVREVKPNKIKAFAGSQWRVRGVSVPAIDQNEELFKRLVEESVRFIEEKRKRRIHG
ncbi:MAG: hypothetical protein WA294_11165 [Acidobacteriaceae bacterium]